MREVPEVDDLSGLPAECVTDGREFLTRGRIVVVVNDDRRNHEVRRR
jgi:hypothetical protein